MRQNLIIAIDGYSSCGKSTLAKTLAKEIDFIYIDSGAMYRAVSLFFIRHQIDLNDLNAVQLALKNIKLNFQDSNSESNILLNGEEVSDEIRQMPVSLKVSEISANKFIRHEMVKQQQQMAEIKNIVMDGRDIGTVVFADAQLKLFMTADPKIRAERRYLEILQKGNSNTTLEEIYEHLVKRDLADITRQESPLKRAADAIILDNTTLTPQEQLNFVLEKVKPFIITRI